MIGVGQALNDDEEQESILGDAAQLSGDVQGHIVTVQEAKQWTLRDIMRMRQVNVAGHLSFVADPCLSLFFSSFFTLIRLFFIIQTQLLLSSLGILLFM